MRAVNTTCALISDLWVRLVNRRAVFYRRTAGDELPAVQIAGVLVTVHVVPHTDTGSARSWYRSTSTLPRVG